MKNMDFELNRLDEYYGNVIEHCRAGIYILLDSGVKVFSYHGAANNSRVLCSLRNIGDPDANRLPTVVISSVFVENIA